MNTTRHTAWPSSGAKWYFRLLGRLEVVSASNVSARFRSRTALSLLAYLSLQKGTECSTQQLHEMFWPESDADRQAQNLRRAVSDLRCVLEEGLDLGSVVVTRRNYVSLNTALVQTDVERFLNLTRGAEHDDAAMVEALGLYAGPLLAPLDESWLLVDRMDLEERFAQLVSAFCRSRVDAGAVNEAIRAARAAVSAAPLREDIHIALITAYRRGGMEAEAIRQYEELERLLHEAWGEAPSERARLSLMEELAEAAPRHGAAWDPSGGALALDSRFYIERSADAQVRQLLKQGEGVVLVQGPRQVGKSSLLARSLAFARTEKIAVAFTDAQALGEAQISETGNLYRTLAHSIAQQLGVKIDIARSWSDWLGPNINLDAIVGKILSQTDGNVCWAIDEADLLFDRPYTNDFFGLLRSWHNRRALDPDGPWKKITLVLAYATEAHLFITDLNQSPFNVGVRMTLRDFSIEEVKSLQSRHDHVKDADSWKTAFEVTRGHPYLSQCAFAFLGKGGSLGQLKQTAARQDGPFGAHLNRLLVTVSQSPEMVCEVKRLLQGEAFENPTTRYRLQSAGVVSISDSGAPTFRAPVYEAYLRSEFS